MSDYSIFAASTLNEKRYLTTSESLRPGKIVDTPSHSDSAKESVFYETIIVPSVRHEMLSHNRRWGRRVFHTYYCYGICGHHALRIALSDIM